MSSESSEPITKITTNLFTHDLEVLQRVFRRYGYQRALRHKVRQWVRTLEARLDQVKEDDPHDLEQLIAGDSGDSANDG